jgi:hypothetical protein
MGIIWVPGKLVQGKAGPLTPVFSATGCTIEGFQVSWGQPGAKRNATRVMYAHLLSSLVVALIIAACAPLPSMSCSLGHVAYLQLW